MFAGLVIEIRSQAAEFIRLTKTKEFWGYIGILCTFVVIGIVGTYFSIGYDDTGVFRGSAKTCAPTNARMGTIIIGAFIFTIACAFTLGTVIEWIEANKMASTHGWKDGKPSFLVPMLYVLGTIVTGVGGCLLMMSWCN